MMRGAARLLPALRFGRALLSYRLSGLPVPLVVAWSITGQCNLRCEHCDQSEIRGVRELGTAEVKNLIAEMNEAGV